jgi:hypothetical protein
MREDGRMRYYNPYHRSDGWPTYQFHKEPRPANPAAAKAMSSSLNQSAPYIVWTKTDTGGGTFCTSLRRYQSTLRKQAPDDQRPCCRS